MSENSPYLGIYTADKPITLPYDSAINGLAKTMRKYGVKDIFRAHRAPCIVRDSEDPTNNPVLHPILSVQNGSYGLRWAYKSLRMGAVSRRSLFGRQRGMRLWLSVDSESIVPNERIGTAVYRPAEDISDENQACVRGVLEGSLGYMALCADYSTVLNKGARNFTLYGQNEDRKLEELPFTFEAASILTEQLCLNLRKDIHRAYDP